MRRFLGSLLRWLVGDPGGHPATEPTIYGYRRALSPSARLGLLLLTAAACLAYAVGFSIMAPARMMPFTVPIAIMGVLIIWALPPGEYAPTKAIDPLYFAFFTAMLVWPNYLAIALPSLPWVTLLRLFAVPLLVVFLVCVSVSEGFRSRMKEILRADPVIWKLLAGLVAIQVVTLALSRDPGDSLNRFIIAQYSLTAMFFISAYLFSRKGFAELWVRMFVILLTIICFVGLWEAQLHRVPWAGQIPSFLKVEDPAVTKILAGFARAASGIYRVQTVHTTPLGFAEILGLAIPFGMHLLFERYALWVRLLGGLFVPLAFFLILLTDSRLGVVASIASVCFYLLIWSLLRWRQNPSSVFGPALVLSYPAILLAVVASTFLVGRIRAEVWGNGPQQASTEARQEQWAMAIPKIFRNPVGNGTGQGADVLGYTNGAGVLTIDSYYITVLLEWGLLGFLLYYGLIIRSAWVAGRTVVQSRVDQEIRLLMPISVSLINFIIVKSVLSQDANHAIVFMMLGAVVALTYRSKRGQSEVQAQATLR